MELNIKVDDREVKRLLLNIDKTVKNMKEPMGQIGDKLIKEYEGTFDKQANLDKKPWQPLQPATIAQRLKIGFGSSPILVRTGKLKKGFHKTVKAMSVYVSNKIKYYPFHQLGEGKNPQRKMLGLTKNLTEDIIEIINKYLRKNIKK